MPAGMLQVSGNIDLRQFWNVGESDADTVKVAISGPNAFRFSPHEGALAAVTHAFDGATVKGKVSKPAIDKQNRIIIRLQGIDAPELHYRPLAPTINKKKPTAQQRTKFNASNGNFRQRFGETASVHLATFLATAGASPIACTVRTAVDDPSEVFDTYGRLVGDIYVTVNGREKDVNLWLCQEGWAYPTFYSSMTGEEINTLIGLSKSARQAKEESGNSSALPQRLRSDPPIPQQRCHQRFRGQGQRISSKALPPPIHLRHRQDRWDLIRLF